MKTRKHLTSYIFLTPYALPYIIFLLVPVIWSFYISLSQGGILTGTTFVGLQNYKKIWGDALFIKCFKNTVFYTVMVVPICMVVSFLVALLLNSIMRLQNFIKLSIFFPLLSPVVSLAIIWKVLLLPGNDGPINYLISRVGLHPQNWLGSPATVIPTLVWFEMWRGYGFWVLMILAGLQALPKDVYESARIDGATGWRELVHITLPLMKPTLLFLLVMGVIWNFQLFDAVYIMTFGGPADSSATVVWYVYRNAFHFERIGYASTMGFVVLVVLLVASIFQMKFLRSGFEY
ncbi:MAG: sugar ABC transporter permease [Firmicutes bacterium]|nr:sugar ABC transporter permease [Bacillota bacterium]